MSFFPGIINCDQAVSNTGTPFCSFDLGLIEAVVLVPRGTRYTQTQIQTLWDVLQAAMLADTQTQRSYIIKNFIGGEDKSSETTINTQSSGRVTLGKQGQFHWVFRYEKGGMNMENILKTFEGQQSAYDLLILDTNANVVVGTQPAKNTSGYVLQGLSLDLIYSPIPKLGFDTADTTHMWGVALSDSTQLTKRMALYQIPATQPVLDLQSPRNLEMEMLPGYTLTAGLAKVRITSDVRAYDMGPNYGAALAALSASWSAVNDSTLAAITITSISYVASTRTLNIQFNASDPDYPSSTGTFTVSTPTITQMTATVPYFGNSTLQFTV